MFLWAVFTFYLLFVFLYHFDKTTITMEAYSASYRVADMFFVQLLFGYSLFHFSPFHKIVAKNLSGILP